MDAYILLDKSSNFSKCDLPAKSIECILICDAGLGGRDEDHNISTKFSLICFNTIPLESNFDFSYKPSKWDTDKIHVWRCRNPVNDLIYGYGGVKLFPTRPLRDANDWHIDFTTSVGGAEKFKPMPLVSNTTRINTDPFTAWKSAFRECVKLSSKIIEKQKDHETDERLNIWCTKGEDRPYGKYAVQGAIAGRDYGLKYRENPAKLDLINDFNWLQKEFDGHESNIR